jgi:hypothetical protein
MNDLLLIVDIAVLSAQKAVEPELVGLDVLQWSREFALD